MMTNKNIKFISTNLSVMILLLVVLISHYSLIGLISYFVGSLLLFLGTLLDDKKSNNGVACKLSFILFISTLILFGMWIPFITKTKPHFEPQGNVNLIGLIIALSLAFIFFVMSSVDRFKHYVVRRCLKYAGQSMLFLAVFFFWDIPINTYPFIVVVVIIDLLNDLYATKYTKYNNNDFKDANNDKSFWMAFLINLCIVALNLFYRDYLQNCISKDSLTKTFEKVTSGFNVPLFIILMLALSAVFIYLQEKSSSYRELSDGYLTLSLAGFVLLFRIYESNRSLESFIILCVAVFVYFIFGFSIPSAGVGTIKNPVYYLIRYRKVGVMIDIVSACTTILSLLGIIYAKKGYIVPIAFFVCAAVIIIVSFLRLKDSWIKINIHWQIALLCILSFLISVSVVNKSFDQALPFLAIFFIVETIAVWTLGLRQDVKNYKYSEIAQGFTCAISLGIGLIAVG